MCKTCVNQKKNMGKKNRINHSLSTLPYIDKNILFFFHYLFHFISDLFPHTVMSILYLISQAFSTVYTPPTITTTYLLKN